MPPQQRLYNGLTRPADYSIFVCEWTCLLAGKSMLAQEWTCQHGQRAAIMVTAVAVGALAYGQCSWATASADRPAGDRRWYMTAGDGNDGTAGQTM